MSRLIDITGQRFGNLVVVKRSGSDKNGKNSLWICQCDCGGSTIATGTHLRNGHTTSCGCVKQKNFVAGGINTRFAPTHNQSRTRLYHTYYGMKARCYNPKNKKYHLYGGRGIAVCAEWLNSFEAFYIWAVANGYRDNLTIDRKDNDKGYSPDNCRWITRAENNRNRRNCKARNGVIV